MWHCSSVPVCISRLLPPSERSWNNLVSPNSCIVHTLQRMKVFILGQNVHVWGSRAASYGIWNKWNSVWPHKYGICIKVSVFWSYLIQKHRRGWDKEYAFGDHRHYYCYSSYFFHFCCFLSVRMSTNFRLALCSLHVLYAFSLGLALSADFTVEHQRSWPWPWMTPVEVWCFINSSCYHVYCASDLNLMKKHRRKKFLVEMFIYPISVLDQYSIVQYCLPFSVIL